MSDQGTPATIPTPRYREGERVILVFLRRSWPAQVVAYRGYHQDSRGKSDHYYKVLFRRGDERDSMRLDIPERCLLKVTEGAGYE
jgi:hypothetical protein